MLNVRHAQKRSGENPLFSGGEAVMIDGIVFHEYRNVYNTSGAPAARSGVPPAPWTAARSCSAALRRWRWPTSATRVGREGLRLREPAGHLDGQILGFLKPKFNSIYAGNTTQDFGVISVYVAQ